MFLNVIILRLVNHHSICDFDMLDFCSCIFVKKKMHDDFYNICNNGPDLIAHHTDERISSSSNSLQKKYIQYRSAIFFPSNSFTLIMVYLFRKKFAKKVFWNTFFKIGTFFTKIIKKWFKGGKILFSCHYFQKLNDPGLESTFFFFTTACMYNIQYYKHLIYALVTQTH